MHNNTAIEHLQAINASLSNLIEQVMKMPPLSQAKGNMPPTSMLIACLVPNITHDMWDACLASERSQHPLLESCVTLELDQNKLPDLYTHIYELIAEADKALHHTKHVRTPSTSQVHVNEKHFLFFGALND